MKKLPLMHDCETKAVLKAAAIAHQKLGELKGIVATILNEDILISTLTLQEARDSSAIENIITTQDELFKAQVDANAVVNIATKEVQNYANALRTGFAKVRKTKILTTSYILAIQEELEGNNAGFRKLPGTNLKNAQTGEVVYTPPQPPEEIIDLMDNLVKYINDNEEDIDPLVKMAIVHHQFESIHPFYDGNGRTGRIINILFLICKDLLQLPVLYLSRYIMDNKGEYYKQLQAVRDSGYWEPWLLYMLKGIEVTASHTIKQIIAINDLMMDYKHRIRSLFAKIYSQDLINTLFKYPYTKIDFVMDDLKISRPTATRYLDELSKAGLLNKVKLSRSNYYINQPLLEIFLPTKDIRSI